MAAIRGVLKAGFLLGQFPALEWQRIQAIDSVKGKRLQAGRCLSNKEVLQLLHTSRHNDSVDAVRASIIIALMAYTGLRRSELVDLDVSDYNQRTGYLCIQSGKGQKQRELLVPKEAREFIRRWLKIRGLEAGPLLCKLTKSGDCLISQRLNAQSVYYVVKKGAHQAGIKSCSPHDLRRTFVTRLLEQGVDLNTTSQLAGHEQIQTTIMYDRRSTKSQKLAMANFHI